MLKKILSHEEFFNDSFSFAFYNIFVCNRSGRLCQSSRREYVEKTAFYGKYLSCCCFALGNEFWTPQTGEMGDGWTYVYTADKIRGFKQTHQPSPWINDYGQFSLMPVTGYKIGQEERASWFSHKAEIATPYYYSVYLADHDITAELTPTERSAAFRFTFPESDSSYIVIDAFDNGSYIQVIP